MEQENETNVEMSIVPSSQDQFMKSEEMETDIMDSNLGYAKHVNTKLNCCPEKEAEEAVDTFKLQLPMEDLIYCPEYSEQIIQAWTHLETLPCFSLHPNFLSCTDIPANTFKHMRVKLMDWLISIQLYLKLSNEALQLTINITDRYTALAPSSVAKHNYQLIGIAALSISSKFEEIAIPDFKLLCDLSENAYSKQQLAAMEKEVYFSLDCCVSNPQPIHFLRFFSILLSRDQLEHTLAKYLLELSLLQADAAHLRPSLRATICLSLASRLLVNNRDVIQTLARLLQVDMNELIQCEESLAAEVRRVNSEGGAGLFVCQKYADKKFNQVSTLQCLSLI